MGPLNLTPGEFWASTPGEIFYLAEGYSTRTYDDMEKFSILATWIINHSGFASKAIRPSNLLKPRGSRIKTGGDIQTQEDVQRMMIEAARYQKTKAWTKLSDKYAKKEDEG